MAKLKARRKSVKKQAEENVEVVKKSPNPNGYGMVEETLEKGRMVDHSEKHLDANTVGLSVGTTVNMGQYESLRVDCWATTDILKGESMEQALDRVGEVLDKKLRERVEFYTDGEDD